MSTSTDTVSKQTIVRLIVPKTIANRILTSLGPLAKTQASNLMVETDKLSTGDIVGHIKDYTRLRDEILQTFRQYDITREANPSLTELPDPEATLAEAQNQLSDVRATLQESRLELENVEREAEHVRKEGSRIEQVSQAGFQFAEISQEMPGYKRVLGRVPTKKLERLQKALRAVFNDRVIIALGARKQEAAYVLVAIPAESYSQILQTLLQYDFAQADLPESSPDNPRDVMVALLKKSEDVAGRQKLVREENIQLRKESALILNNIADKTQDIMMILRAALRLGEGTNAAFILARFEKPASTAVLEPFLKDGVFEEELA